MNKFIVPLVVAAAASAAEHSHTEFHLAVHLPYEQTFPLFGAWNEQKWASDWHPEFLYPQPPEDREGAVFRVEHGHQSSVWMTTRFDPTAGRIEHVHVQNGLIFTRIQLRVTSAGPHLTNVDVVYERTSLRPEADEHVRTLSAHDAKAGLEWQTALDAYSAKAR